MDSGPPLKRVSPISFLSWEKDSWGKDGSRGSIQHTQSVYPALFDFTHTLMAFQMKPCCTVHIFYIFVTFKKKSAGLFLIIGWTLCFRIICVCSLSDTEVCKVPSAGQVEILQQTLHGKFGWTADNKGTLDRLNPSNFQWYKILVILLAKSEDFLPASSQLQKFF